MTFLYFVFLSSVLWMKCQHLNFPLGSIKCCHLSIYLSISRVKWMEMGMEKGENVPENLKWLTLRGTEMVLAE